MKELVGGQSNEMEPQNKLVAGKDLDVADT